MKEPEDSNIRINTIQSRGIILKDDSVLLMYRKKNEEEYYVFPGGHMQEGEEPIETVTREITEETTINVKDLNPAFEFKNFVKEKKVVIDYYYVGYWDKGDPKLSGEESRRCSKDNFYQPLWIPLIDIKSLNIYPLMAKEWVELYLERFLENNN